MKAIIFTEGGKGIGFGHVVRCVALYDAFKESGIKPVLVINGDQNIASIVCKRKCYFLNWLQNNKKAFSLINSSDIAVVDSYLAKPHFYKKISDLASATLCIDDNKRINYPKGLVMNGSVYARNLNYPKNSNIKYLLGSKYICLRKEFLDTPGIKINKTIKNILVIFGGEDPQNMTPKVLTVFNKTYPLLNKKVIVSKGFKNIKEIELAKGHRTELIYFPQAKTVKKAMLESDAAVSAAGQTLYELARLGLPTIAVVVAKNQINHSQYLKRAGFLAGVSCYKEKNFAKNICVNLDKLSFSRRVRISHIGRKMIDGQGARRVVDEIMKYLQYKKKII